MKLNCPKCQAEITIEDTSPDKIARWCVYCGTVFDHANTSSNSQITVQKLHFSPSPNIKLKELENVLILNWRWFHWQYIVMAIVGSGLNAIVLPLWGVFIVETYQKNSGLFSLGGLCFPHGWIGVFIIYYAIAGFINETTITVGKGKIVVQHGPVPSFGNKKVDAKEIIQLYTAEQHGRKGKRSYSVKAVLQSNQQKTLLSGLFDADYAFYIEQQIERYLTIQDYPISGEYGR